MAKICWIPDSTSKNFLDSKIPPILLHGAEGRSHDLYVFFFLTFLTQTTLLHFTTALVKTVLSAPFVHKTLTIVFSLKTISYRFRNNIKILLFLKNRNFQMAAF